LDKIPVQSIQPNPVIPDPEIQQPNVEAPAVTTFSVENQTLQTLLTPALQGVSFAKLISTVNAISDKKMRTDIQWFLKEGMVQQAQMSSGMKVNSRYDDNIATGMIDTRTIERWASPVFGLSGKALLDAPTTMVAADVKLIYQRFVNEKLNGNLWYAIVSKTDCNLYLFNKFHKLISVHKVLLGSQIGDAPNDAFVEDASQKTRTTPGWMYHIDNRKDFPADYAGPGEYVSLLPEEGQYHVRDRANPQDQENPNDYTLWIHTYYTKGKTDRLGAFDKPAGRGRRVSSGCINTLVQWAPYDNLRIWSKFYVTKE